MSNQQPDISICIVGPESFEKLYAFLRAVPENPAVIYEVLVWDSAAEDGIVSEVRARYPEIRTFGAGDSSSHAQAKNVLFAEAKSRLFYLLNPDNQIAPDRLFEIANFFDRNPAIGIADTNTHGADYSPFNAAIAEYSHESHTRGELGKLSGRFASVAGQSMVIRREVFAVTGGFDPSFAFHVEDDLCLRARQNGWQIGKLPSPSIPSPVTADGEETPEADFWQRKTDATWQFYRKHYSAQTRLRIARDTVLQSRWRIATALTRTAKTKRTQYRQELVLARKELKSLRSLQQSAALEGFHDSSVREVLEAGFCFKPFVVPGIDNQKVADAFGADLRLQEVALLARETPNASSAIDELHRFVWNPSGGARPIARFADGEYAFYRLDAAGCNGLYLQAENRESIVSALPHHIKALRSAASCGKLCPLIYPAISRPRRVFGGRENKNESAASRWLRFLGTHGIKLCAGNYSPFYAVYAYLCGKRFAQSVDGKNLLILNDEYQADEAAAYFAARGSRPNLHWHPVPGEYAATRWPSAKDSVLSQLPNSVDMALVGAGAGALLICDDVSQALGIPAIDAGHFLNVLNGRAGKSGGPRLFALYETDLF